MESQLQNPEFRINPENFQTCSRISTKISHAGPYILTLVLLYPDSPFFENTVDPDQMASDEAI